MHDYKQEEQNIKKIIDREVNQKTKIVLDQNLYTPQIQILTQDCLQQCERTSQQKAAKEVVEFRAGVITSEKVIEAIRSANFVEIQNVNNRFKRLLKEILEQIGEQLGNLFKKEFLQLWLDWKNAKMSLQEKEIKLKQSELAQQVQEQELVCMRTQFNVSNTFQSLNKKLESALSKLENENTQLKESLAKLTQEHNDLKISYDNLNKLFLNLKQHNEEQRQQYENEITQLKLQISVLTKANKDLIDLVNQLQTQAEKYKDLYENQNQKNIDLMEQLKYWKSTHQQRLTDLQHSEQRIGSQKGYLFKYRREVQDLKRFKLYGEEAQKELSNARQTVHLLNQQTEQLRVNYQNAVTQQLNIQIEKTDNLNQILIKNASSKKSNNETNVFYESPQKFDFNLLKRSAQPNEELSQFVLSYQKMPLQNRTRVRSCSAKKQYQSECETSKINLPLPQEFEQQQLTPFSDKNLQHFQFSLIANKNKFKRQNTQN